MLLGSGILVEGAQTPGATIKPMAQLGGSLPDC